MAEERRRQDEADRLAEEQGQELESEQQQAEAVAARAGGRGRGKHFFFFSFGTQILVIYFCKDDW